MNANCEVIMNSRTCIKDFAENKRNEFSQHSRTSGSNSKSPECELSEEGRPASDEFTLVDKGSSSSSGLASAVFFTGSSCSLSFDASDAEMLPSGVQKSVRISNDMLNAIKLKICCVLDETCTCL